VSEPVDPVPPWEKKQAVTSKVLLDPALPVINDIPADIAVNALPVLLPSNASAVDHLPHSAVKPTSPSGLSVSDTSSIADWHSDHGGSDERAPRQHGGQDRSAALTSHGPRDGVGDSNAGTHSFFETTSEESGLPAGDRTPRTAHSMDSAQPLMEPNSLGGPAVAATGTLASSHILHRSFSDQSLLAAAARRVQEDHEDYADHAHNWLLLPSPPTGAPVSFVNTSPGSSTSVDSSHSSSSSSDLHGSNLTSPSSQPVFLTHMMPSSGSASAPSDSRPSFEAAMTAAAASGDLAALDAATSLRSDGAISIPDADPDVTSSVVGGHLHSDGVDLVPASAE